MPFIHSLIGDEAQNDFRDVRPVLLKRLFPTIRGLKVLTNGAYHAKAGNWPFYVSSLEQVNAAAIVTIAPADTVRIATERLARVRKAALNSQRVVPEMQHPFEGAWGAGTAL